MHQQYHIFLAMLQLRGAHAPSGGECIKSQVGVYPGWRLACKSVISKVDIARDAVEIIPAVLRLEGEIF